jgi:hypothetical protein
MFFIIYGEMIIQHLREGGVSSKFVIQGHCLI